LGNFEILNVNIDRVEFC